MNMLVRFAAALTALAALTLPVRAELNVQEVTSPGEIKAWLVQEPSIPFTALEIRFRGGTSLDAPGKRGAVTLMTALLDEGSGDLDARAYTRATESLSAYFSFRSNDDRINISAMFLTENRDQSVALLRDAITKPRFDQSAMDRVRTNLISSLQSDLKRPGAILSKTVRAKLYGDHPYGSDGDGTIESVGALTRDDLIAAYKAAIARDRVYVSAVGDITPEQLSKILDQLFADLPEKGAPTPADVTPAFDGKTKVVDYKTPQSMVSFGQPGLDIDHPDYFAVYLLNSILGSGGFDTRLMTEVRVKRGLTYGVHSYLVHKDHANAWMGSVSSANDRVAEAIKVIRSEWERIHRDGVTEQELNDAKTYMTGSYPLRFSGNDRIARILVAMQMSGMPRDYIKTRNDKVRAVTLDQANEVARRVIDPAKLTFVVVGQPQGLKAD